MNTKKPKKDAQKAAQSAVRAYRAAGKSTDPGGSYTGNEQKAQDARALKPVQDADDL